MAVPNIEDIREYNPWEEGKTFDVPSFKRDYYHEILSIVKKRNFITAITGLRRIGKTVLMKQIGNELDGNKYFFSFEEDPYANYASLKTVIETFLRMGEKPTIFLDEIGRINGWAGLLKKYHDLGKATFVVSGSSSLQLTKGKESLAGRMMEFSLTPWGFSEFLKLNGIDPKSPTISNPEKSYLSWKSQSEKLHEFIRTGGFPELHSLTDVNLIKKYVRSTTVDKIIFEDLPKTFNIEDITKVYDIMEYVARESGNIMVTSHLGEALEISKDTVRKYLLYLNYAYLIGILPIEGSTLKSFKKPKKVYVASPSISYGMFPNTDESRLAESAVYQKLSELTNKLFFYRDPQKREVDFSGEFIVEVKWKEKIMHDDLKTLVYYLTKRNKNYGILVTKKEFDRKEIDGKVIFLLPLDFFLALSKTL